MIITAKFIGNNSLGYENGIEYKLKLANNSGSSIRRLDNTGVCSYESISAFLRNWDNIKQ